MAEGKSRAELRVVALRHSEALDEEWSFEAVVESADLYELDVYDTANAIRQMMEDSKFVDRRPEGIGD